MAGHSKWSNIKHRKERQDKKRGAAWSKCSRAIIAAARNGGPDPDTNLTLRYAIDEAKYANMPKDTIHRAIEKGAGAGEGDNYEEVIYEGYGPGGAAMIVTALTDNKTRTVADVRSFFKKGGGTLGQPGSVSFSFQTKGQFVIEGPKTTEDQLMEVALDAGADEIESPEGDEGVWTVLCDPADFTSVRDALDSANIEIASAEITKLPTNTIEVTGDDVRKLMNLIETLEDSDDVQKVYNNAEISDEELAALE